CVCPKPEDFTPPFSPFQPGEFGEPPLRACFRSCRAPLRNHLVSPSRPLRERQLRCRRQRPARDVRAGLLPRSQLVWPTAETVPEQKTPRTRPRHFGKLGRRHFSSWCAAALRQLRVHQVGLQWARFKRTYWPATSCSDSNDER